MATSNPVSVASLKAAIPSPNANKCERFVKGLIRFPVLITQFYSWAVTSLGKFSVDFKRDANFVMVGDYIFSGAFQNEITGEGGRLLCNGQEVDKTDYPSLYTAIGDTYGAATSAANFKLPDFSGRFPIGVGVAAGRGGPYALGDDGGAHEVELTDPGMNAPHRHGPPENNLTYMGLSDPPVSGDTGSAAGAAFEYDSTETGESGGGTPHENRPPFLAGFVYIQA